MFKFGIFLVQVECFVSPVTLLRLQQYGIYYLFRVKDPFLTKIRHFNKQNLMLKILFACIVPKGRQGCTFIQDKYATAEYKDVNLIGSQLLR